jgi:hypothetical protein
MSILVGELTLSNEHQLRMKEIEYLEVAKRSSDLFTTQLEGGAIKLYYTYQSFISLPPTLPSSLYSPSHSIPSFLPPLLPIPFYTLSHTIYRQQSLPGYSEQQEGHGTSIPDQDDSPGGAECVRAGVH